MHLDFQMSDSDTIYALDTHNYHLNKNNFELPHRNPLPEITKIIKMEVDYNDGNIKWAVLIKGHDEPVLISHPELRFQNPQLMIKYFQENLLLPK